MRFRAQLVTLTLALLAGACAASPTPDLAAFAAVSGANSFEGFDRTLDSSDALVLDLVHDRQTSGPSCGAHALASVINYWRPEADVTGEALYSARPPAAPAGYAMSEVMALAVDNGLLASAVRLDEDNVIRELEAGRPVLVPIRLPSAYVQQRTLLPGDPPLVGPAKSLLVSRTGRAQELAGIAMLDHYVLVAGYGEDHFVVLEPVMGYRTISRERLSRFRAAFGDAAIVFSRASG